MPRFRKGDVVVRTAGHEILKEGTTYTVRWVDGDFIGLEGRSGTYSSYGFKLCEEEEVVRPSWFVDVPPTPP
jgi:hypothetical protein